MNKPQLPFVCLPFSYLLALTPSIKFVFFSSSPIMYLFLESRAICRITILVPKLRQLYAYLIVSIEHFLTEEDLETESSGIHKYLNTKTKQVNNLHLLITTRASEKTSTMSEQKLDLYEP